MTRSVIQRTDAERRWVGLFPRASIATEVARYHRLVQEALPRATDLTIFIRALKWWPS